MSVSCAIIVCDHGLGHVRRCALLGKSLELQGQRVTLFAPRASVERVQRAMPYTNGLSVQDFMTRTTPSCIRQGLTEAVEWLERVPNLDNFENVICDNLPEILKLRPDAIILGQFFWHDVIKGAAIEYADYCEQLLALNKPEVIGCELFAMEAVRKQPGFRGVGLYKNPELVSTADATPLECRTDLLVTGGSTSTVRDKLILEVDSLIKSGNMPYGRVHVDPKLIPPNPPDWMTPANFSASMYCSLKDAVCRPGLGVVTDLLTVGVIPRAVFEQGNAEMEFNAKVLKKIAGP